MLIRVNGTPAPQGSKRHVGNGILVESSKRVGPWREAVRAETQRAMAGQDPMAGAVVVHAWFFVHRPASHYGRRGGVPYVKPTAPRHPYTRPDLDKLVRAVLDGLTEGGAVADDSQVANLAAWKHYADSGHPMGAVIEVETLK